MNFNEAGEGHGQYRARAQSLLDGLRLVGEGVAELLWPTRCVICDVPGTLLCHSCRTKLPYIDRLHACPVCGQAHGRYACVDCNSFIEDHRELRPEEVIDQIVSVISFMGPARKLITTYKDRKELRLHKIIAELMNEYLDPKWIEGDQRNKNIALVPIPARKQALRERGFDHMLEVGKEISRLSGLPLIPLLAPNPNERKDQRGLSAQSRRQNMNDSFVPSEMYLENGNVILPSHVIVIDDVLTTGATITAAATVMKSMGVEKIYGLTFARLP